MLSLLFACAITTSSSNEYWIELLNLVGRQVVYLVYKVSKGIASLNSSKTSPTPELKLGVTPSYL
jgi:hypothetical protein